jgi:hypothetical protein
MYHDIKKIDCLTVLEKEKEVCNQIIEYKKKMGQDYDTWDFKKTNIDVKINFINTNVEKQVWDYETYIKKIKEEYKYEQKLLTFIEKDPMLKPEQKQVVKDRINNRKKFIKEELAGNPCSEGGEETKKEEEKKPKTQPTPQKKEVITPKSTKGSTGEDNIDVYPEAVENKYHNVGKMDSIAVLKKELELCDEIINYKKARNEDYEKWAFKKDTIQTRMNTILSEIESGIMNFDAYKTKIKGEHIYETKLLQFVEKDPIIKEAQKKKIIERVKARKKIIEEELVC